MVGLYRKNLSTQTRIKRVHQMLKRVLDSHEKCFRLNCMLDDQAFSYLTVLKLLATKKCALPPQQEDAERFVRNLLQLFYESLNSEPTADEDDVPQTLKLALKHEKTVPRYFHTVERPPQLAEIDDTEPCYDNDEVDNGQTNTGEQPQQPDDEIESRIQTRRGGYFHMDNLDFSLPENRTSVGSGERIAQNESDCHDQSNNLTIKPANEMIDESRPMCSTAISDSSTRKFSISTSQEEINNHQRKSSIRRTKRFGRSLSSSSVLEKISECSGSIYEPSTIVEQSSTDELTLTPNQSSSSQEATVVVAAAAHETQKPDLSVVMVQQRRRQTRSRTVMGLDDTILTSHTMAADQTETSISAGRYSLRNTPCRQSRIETSINIGMTMDETAIKRTRRATTSRTRTRDTTPKRP